MFTPFFVRANFGGFGQTVIKNIDEEMLAPISARAESAICCIDLNVESSGLENFEMYLCLSWHP